MNTSITKFKKNVSYHRCRHENCLEHGQHAGGTIMEHLRNQIMAFNDECCGNNLVAERRSICIKLSWRNRKAQFSGLFCYLLVGRRNTWEICENRPQLFTSCCCCCESRYINIGCASWSWCDVRTCDVHFDPGMG